ncbi:MAG: metallophosphoesterase family protein [Candidatus Lindowbacteria bacterium]|nr:metallophosphoesterase family protein [Candidatus Lindowbacteria bacterium]
MLILRRLKLEAVSWVNRFRALFQGGKRKCVLVVSDSHSNINARFGNNVPEKLDLIIHCGDVSTEETLREFEKYGEVKVVCGNVEETKMLAELPESLEFEFEKVRFLVVHHPTDIPDLVKRATLEGRRPHVVLYGHTHMPDIKWGKDLIFINPGPVGSRRFNIPPSFAELSIFDGQVLPIFTFL